MAALYSILLILVHVITSACQNIIPQELSFNTPEAERIFTDVEILGNTTHFSYPLDMGGFTDCDRWALNRAFNADFELHTNYTSADKDNLNALAAGYYGPELGFRNSNGDLNIGKNTVTLKGCLNACITLRRFLCRSFDFYPSEQHTCSLYSASGDYLNTSSTHYVTRNPSSAHYTIMKDNEEKPDCTRPETVTQYFALGWKAMENGWTDLAHDQFNKVISENPGYYMAYIGKILSADKFGHRSADDKIGSYAEKVQEISGKDDLPLKLTEQQLLLVDALKALHTTDDFKAGLKAMIGVFFNSEQKDDYVIKAISGNTNLLQANLYQSLLSLARNNVFGLRYITRNLNPYKEFDNEEDRVRTTPALRNAAVESIERYKDLSIKGSAQITIDCVDIAEYYARWSVGQEILSAFSTFMWSSIDTTTSKPLFREEESVIITNGLNVPYVDNSWVRAAAFEKLHFFFLQMAKFIGATDVEFIAKDRYAKTKYEWIPLVMLRMDANKYFSTYDYIADNEAASMEFVSDWEKPLPASADDLTRVSRAYYWTAAAVQALRKGDNSVADTIESKLQAAVGDATNDPYKNLLDLYLTVLQGTRQAKKGQTSAAKTSANKAGELNSVLVGRNFTWAINDVPESKHFRMLVPLGFQFKADTLNALRADTENAPSLSDVVAAYKEGVNTPPLNNSRLMKGYADRLKEEYGETPKRKGEERPAFVQAYEFLFKNSWSAPDDPNFGPKAEAEKSVEYYTDRAYTFCQVDEFQFKSEKELCWGGYVIIGVIVAIVVIIAIIIGILCLRRKAQKPVKDKEAAQGFIFSGPDLSQRDDTSSFHMSSLSRSPSNATPYASQTLDINRSYSNSAMDYTARSQTLGNEGYSAH